MDDEGRGVTLLNDTSLARHSLHTAWKFVSGRSYANGTVHEDAVIDTM